MTIFIVLLIIAVVIFIVTRGGDNKKTPSAFTGKSKPEPPSSTEFPKKQNVSRKIHKSNKFLTVDHFDFFGPYSESPNGLFTIAWSDADLASGVGGFRDSGEGSYILLEKEDILLTGKMQRPNDGCVANNGTFVLNDWMFGEGLKGIFYAIDKAGGIIVKQKFEANLYNNGISSDGRFAVCQTCFSENSHSGILSLFDLATGNSLWSQQPTCGWASTYEFDNSNQVLTLSIRDIGKFRYSFSGDFLDASQWEESRINHANGFQLTSIANERLAVFHQSKDPALAEEILSLLERALKSGFDDYPNQRALTYRTMGEVHEALGDIKNTIEHFEKALEINPKVGVKRRLEALRKTLHP